MKFVQTEFSGRRSTLNLRNILKQLNSKNIFLVTGKNSYTLSGAESVIDNIITSYNTEYFRDYSPNPKLEEVMWGITRFNEFRGDTIIAVGGGSSIDVAKCIAALHPTPERAENIVRGGEPPSLSHVHLIAIPTTAGTGSEATHFAVLYVDGKKFSLSHQRMLPRTTILDAEFADAMNSSLAATTGFDAFSQAIESYWAKNSTSESRGYARKAIEILSQELLESTVNNNSRSREKVLLAANFSGKAINISKTTGPHALSYKITQLTGTPHGHAVALTLGSFFSLHEIKMDQVSPSVTLLFEELFKLLGVCNFQEAEAYWYDLMGRCGLSTDFNSITRRDPEIVSQIVQGANLERLKNHPLQLDNRDLKYIIDHLKTRKH